MSTKKQDMLKKEIFENTKRYRTMSDVNRSISLEDLQSMGLKFKFDNSRDYFRKTTKEVQLLKEQQLKEDHRVTRRGKIAYITACMEKLPDDIIEELYQIVEENEQNYS